MEAKYNLKHAKEILEPYAPKGYMRFDERGVWPNVERDLLLLTETEGLRWQTRTPRRSLMPNGRRSSRRCAVAARWAVAPKPR